MLSPVSIREVQEHSFPKTRFIQKSKSVTLSQYSLFSSSNWAIQFVRSRLHIFPFRFCFVLRLALDLRVHPGHRGSLGETEEMGETVPLATVEGPYFRQHHLRWKARVLGLRQLCPKAQQQEGKYSHSRSQFPKLCLSQRRIFKRAVAKSSKIKLHVPTTSGDKLMASVWVFPDQLMNKSIIALIYFDTVLLTPTHTQMDQRLFSFARPT